MNAAARYLPRLNQRILVRYIAVARGRAPNALNVNAAKHVASGRFIFSFANKIITDSVIIIPEQSGIQNVTFLKRIMQVSIFESRLRYRLSLLRFIVALLILSRQMFG